VGLIFLWASLVCIVNTASSTAIISNNIGFGTYKIEGFEPGYPEYLER
jgi:hypothetical protein